MKLKLITRLLIDAHRQDLEEKLWQQWLVEFERMDSSNFISFEKYKDDAFKLVDNTKYNKEQILKDAEAIKKADQASKKANENEVEFKEKY